MSDFVGDPLNIKIRYFDGGFAISRLDGKPVHLSGTGYEAFKLKQEQQTLGHMQEFISNLTQRSSSV